LDLACRTLGHQPRLVLLPRHGAARRRNSHRSPQSTRATTRQRRGARKWVRRERAFAAARQTDRRTGSAARPLRNEHLSRAAAGLRRLQAHALRWMALGKRSARSWSRARALRPLPERQNRVPQLTPLRRSAPGRALGMLSFTETATHPTKKPDNRGAR